MYSNYYPNYNNMSNNYALNKNNFQNQNDDRIIGGGFLGPFILGGITGGLVAPAFYGNGYGYNRPYCNGPYCYQNPGYYYYGGYYR